MWSSFFGCNFFSLESILNPCLTFVVESSRRPCVYEISFSDTTNWCDDRCDLAKRSACVSSQLLGYAKRLIYAWIIFCCMSVAIIMNRLLFELILFGDAELAGISRGRVTVVHEWNWGGAIKSRWADIFCSWARSIFPVTICCVMEAKRAGRVVAQNSSERWEFWSTECRFTDRWRRSSELSVRHKNAEFRKFVN